MNIDNAKEFIELSGDKIWKIANRSYIPPQRLSGYLNNSNTLNENQKYRFYRYLRFMEHCDYLWETGSWEACRCGMN